MTFFSDLSRFSFVFLFYYSKKVQPALYKVHGHSLHSAVKINQLRHKQKDLQEQGQYQEEKNHPPPELPPEIERAKPETAINMQ